ncbi:MAG: DsbE family thiol:disulfide interchange protein [Rhodobacteraceae bacterium]|nr:DsbE family thiol:disulfide interchange protein [Paracoccaceae bacterium]
MSEPEQREDGPTSAPPRRRSPSAILLLPLLIFAMLAGLFLFQLTLGGDPQTIPSALLDKPAPETNLPPLAGLMAKEPSSDTEAIGGFDTEDLIGKVTVVNIFASWCAPCRAEHPLLMQLSERNDIQLVGINYKDTPQNALRFLGALGNPYDRVGVDEKGRTSIDWGVYGVPETFVVDQKGTIRYKFIGPLTETTYKTTFLPQLDAILNP